MNIYHYHPVTCEYINTGNVKLDPIGKKPLIPANATLTQPPEVNINQVPLFVNGNWIVATDYRGYVGYDVVGAMHEITEIATEPDSTWTTTPPFILSDAQAIKIAEINAATRLTIVSGFTSDALGTTHLYQSEQEDQLNLAGIAGNGQDRVFKCSSDDGVTWSYQMHTAAQLNQVASDGIDFKTAALVAGESAKNQVRALTDTATQETIDAIEVVY